MKNRCTTLVLSLGVLLLFGVGAYAQSRPDFSGTWNLDAEKTAAPNPGPRGRGGRGGGPMTITQDEKTLKIERSFGENSFTQSYNLDGSDSTNAFGRGGQQVSNAKWDGDTLVITTKGPNGDLMSKYSLEGGELKVESTRPGRNGEAMTSTQYYKKGSERR